MPHHRRNGLYWVKETHTYDQRPTAKWSPVLLVDGVCFLPSWVPAHFGTESPFVEIMLQPIPEPDAPRAPAEIHIHHHYYEPDPAKLGPRPQWSGERHAFQASRSTSHLCSRCGAFIFHAIHFLAPSLPGEAIENGPIEGEPIEGPTIEGEQL